jgi:hypothetical protein
LDLFKGLAATGEFGNDGIDGGGPDEWFGVFVPSGQKLFDGADEILDTQERVAADTLVGQFGELALN